MISSRSAQTSAKSEFEDKPRLPGVVYAFVSAKGGTGKTLLAASTVHLLTRAGKRAVAVDLDFSTRGLSLYLLGDSVHADIQFANENCLAESLLHHVPPWEVRPRTVVRDGLSYSVILANREVRGGGSPPNELLGANGPGLASPFIDAERLYADYLVKVCDALRGRFDYVILDTRGGFDFSSAGAAAAADGYIIVLEADALSLDQVRALTSGISEHASTSHRSPNLRGFIVNKALFSIEDETFPKQLELLYGRPTLGVIPSDRMAIASYQRKGIPALRAPESDFAYFSCVAIENLVSPNDNWDREDASRFRAIKGAIAAEWAGRRQVDVLSRQLPTLYLFAIALATLLYLVYRTDPESTGFTPVYWTVSVTLVGGFLGSFFRVLQRLPASLPKAARLGVVTAGALGLVLLVMLFAVDIPKTFSTDPLLSRLQAQSDLVKATERQRDSVLNVLSAAQRRLAIFSLDSATSRGSIATDSAIAGFRRRLDSLNLANATASARLASLVDSVRALKASDARLRASYDSATRLISSGVSQRPSVDSPLVGEWAGRTDWGFCTLTVGNGGTQTLAVMSLGDSSTAAFSGSRRGPRDVVLRLVGMGTETGRFARFQRGATLELFVASDNESIVGKLADPRGGVSSLTLRRTRPASGGP